MLKVQMLPFPIQVSQDVTVQIQKQEPYMLKGPMQLLKIVISQ